VVGVEVAGPGHELSASLSDWHWWKMNS